MTVTTPISSLCAFDGIEYEEHQWFVPVLSSRAVRLQNDLTTSNDSVIGIVSDMVKAWRNLNQTWRNLSILTSLWLQ